MGRQMGTQESTQALLGSNGSSECGQPCSLHGRWGGRREGGCGHKKPHLLLSTPGRRFHCGGKKKRRWVRLGFKAALSLLLAAKTETGLSFHPSP